MALRAGGSWKDDDVRGIRSSDVVSVLVLAIPLITVNSWSNYVETRIAS